MQKSFAFIVISAIVLMCGSVRAADPIKHDFLVIDEGAAHLMHVNDNDPSKDWIVASKPESRDMQLIGGNRVLIGHGAGYTEFDIADGKILKDVSTFTGVTSARRLPNGNTLLAGVNLGGATGVVILELDPKDEVKNKIVYPGNYVRLVRQTSKGTYLMVCDTMIREGDASGKTVWEAKVEGYEHAWKAVRLPNGNTLSSAGYGGFMVELTPTGAIARKFGSKASVAAEINSRFLATFQLLPNGNVVVANWQGHGLGHGASGKQLFELDKSGAVVWQWSKAEIISSLQGILILDGLDTKVLHDERNGVMEPVK